MHPIVSIGRFMKAVKRF
ncbi:hypothetical protein LINGRAHAP2_LOCUS27321 [Linum grandiflorum]